VNVFTKQEVKVNIIFIIRRILIRHIPVKGKNGLLQFQKLKKKSSQIFLSIYNRMKIFFLFFLLLPEVLSKNFIIERKREKRERSPKKGGKESKIRLFLSIIQ
jgi:hypothetical protein